MSESLDKTPSSSPVEEEDSNSTSSNKRTLGEDRLRRCELFEGLSDHDCHLVQNAGEELCLKQTETLTSNSQSLGFLNVVLSGQVQIKKASALEERTIDLKEGGFFGPIYSMISNEKFQSAKMLTDCEIFVLHGDALSTLIRILPQFNKHISSLRALSAVSSAKEYQERLQLHHQFSDPSVKLQVAPRLSVWERNVTLTLQSGDVYRVQDVSASGIGILGKVPQNVGTVLSFLFEGSSLNMSSIPLKGKITRVDKDNFAIQLVDFTPQTRAAWEEVIVRAMTVDIALKFSPVLTELKEPLSVLFEMRGFYHSGTIKSLGLDGALLETSEPLASGQLTLSADFKFNDQEKPKSLLLSCRVIEKQGQGYLLKFLNLDVPSKQTIQKFLFPEMEAEEKISTENQIQANVETPSHIQEMIHAELEPEAQVRTQKQEDKDEKRSEQENLEADMIPTPLRVRMNTREEFFDLYFGNLRNHLIQVEHDKSHRVGKLLRIHLEALDPIADQRREFMRFELGGKITETSGQKTYISLDKDSLSELAKIREIVEQHCYKMVEESYTHSSDHPELVKKPRQYIQFVLIVILLGAAIVWGLYKLKIESFFP